MQRPAFLKTVLAIVLALPALGAGLSSLAPPVTVHEWGTFTSVAGRNGEAVSWAPLFGAADLPCFVHRLGDGQVKYMPGLVRMETPVVYFYAPQQTKISVHVDLPEGSITEWYPKESRVSPGALFSTGLGKTGSIDWDDVSVLPGSTDALPASKGASRYYAARATDSAILRTAGETEKLLFYRGVASFKVPVAASFDNGRIWIRHDAAQPLPLVILFDNQNGHMGYRVERSVASSLRVDTPPLTANLTDLRRDLSAALEKAGLYPKEAAAMLETWRDSWFEEGMRVLYILPGSRVDTVLPLKISPVPAEVQRVFVGRVEVLSPWMETTIRAAMESGDTRTLGKFGRFLRPFLDQIKATGDVKTSQIPAAYAAAVTTPGTCVQ